jgi:hypothetical protein
MDKLDRQTLAAAVAVDLVVELLELADQEFLL